MNPAAHRYFGGSSVRGPVEASDARTFREIVDALQIGAKLPISRADFLALDKKQRNEAKQVPFFVPACFKNSPSKRASDQATHCNLIFLDIDELPDGSCPAARFVNDPKSLYTALEEFNFAAHLTASSTPEKPRMRIIVDAEQIPLSEYPRAVATVGALLGLPAITRESSVPVQPMFRPVRFKDSPDDYQPLIAYRTDASFFWIGDIPDSLGTDGSNGSNGAAQLNGSDPNGDALDNVRAPDPEVSLAIAREALFAIDPDCSRPEWINCAAALKHQFSQREDAEAFEIFDEWSSRGEKYGGKRETQKEWKSLHQTPNGRPPITIRSLLRRAEAEGWLSATHSPVIPLGDLLDSTEKFLCKFVAFGSPSQALIIALWIAHAHAIEAFDFTPYLNVRSPMKRCGKSLTLDAVRLLVPRPWFAVSPSEAVVYRKIEADMPTLLLDEVDTIFVGGRDENKEGLRALLNAGFNRSATVPRCVGPLHLIQEFRVFCPKIIAGIGTLPDTVADRSIPIVLVRKTKGQVVERFRTRDAEHAAAIIRESLATWAASPETIGGLRSARPSVPEALNDRQSDICEPLLAIADAVGAEWPQRARSALIELFGGSDANDENLAVRLLSAIRDAFSKSRADKLSTDEILNALLDCDGAPWVSWWEKDMTRGNMRGPAARLSKMLKPFGIVSGTIRQSDGSTLKGYKAEAFADAWERYL